MVQDKRNAAMWLAVVLAISSGCSTEPEPTPPGASLFEPAADPVAYGAMEGWPTEVQVRRVGEAFHSDVEQLEVENEVARQPPTGTTHGVGLRNIASRMSSLFGDDFQLSHSREGDRFVVRVDFPAGEAPPA